MLLITYSSYEVAREFVKQLKTLQSIHVQGMELDKRRANNVQVCNLPAGSPFFCLNCVQPLTFSSGFLLKEDQ